MQIKGAHTRYRMRPVEGNPVRSASEQSASAHNPFPCIKRSSNANVNDGGGGGAGDECILCGCVCAVLCCACFMASVFQVWIQLERCTIMNYTTTYATIWMHSTEFYIIDMPHPHPCTQTTTATVVYSLDLVLTSFACNNARMCFSVDSETRCRRRQHRHSRYKFSWNDCKSEQLRMRLVSA